MSRIEIIGFLALVSSQNAARMINISEPYNITILIMDRKDQHTTAVNPNPAIRCQCLLYFIEVWIQSLILSLFQSD